MRIVKFALGLLFCLAACVSSNRSAQEHLSNEGAGAGKSIVVQPTLLPGIPRLLSPIDGAVFDNATNIILSWQWAQPLSDSEYFAVRVWREDKPRDGFRLTKESSLHITDWLLTQDSGEFFWSVVVLAVDDSGQPVNMVTAETPPERFIFSTSVMSTAAIVQVPNGFEVTKYAQLSDSRTSSTAITVITLGSDEKTLYVLMLDGRIFTLQDTDGDGHAETVTPIFLNQDHTLDYAVGMAFHNGVMYISDAGRVSRLLDKDSDGILDTLVPIVKGLPSREYIWHSNNGIAFGPDNKLYVAIGATSDYGPLKEQQESMILRMNPDGSDIEIFATGFRNPYDLTFSPRGGLFTADNGPDTGPPEVSPDRWVEELDYVLKGRDYGFPRVFGFPPPDDPSEPPVAEFLPHTVSSGLVYYAADQFPEYYRNGVFVSQWGGGYVDNGHMVVFVHLTLTDDGRYQGAWEPFATFDVSVRPVDITVGSDGALYIAEWTRGWVFRVVYQGE